ncbi:MAG: HIT domain-containing protein [Gemmatimonadaceae bacterium]
MSDLIPTAADPGCLFCRIVAGTIPATLVASTPEAIAFRDIAPQAPVHVLVVPRAHLPSLDAAEDPALLGAVLALARRVAREQGIAEGGYRCVINTGDDGGQTVGHLHLHLLGGRAHGWPPG